MSNIVEPRREPVAVEGVNHPDITPSTALLLLANRPKNQDATRLDAPAATPRSRELWVPQGRQPAMVARLLTHTKSL